MCGEKLYLVIILGLQRGSPPRVRGKVHGMVNSLLVSRITPACAGKSAYIDEVQNWFKDHPRVCGEK